MRRSLILAMTLLVMGCAPSADEGGAGLERAPAASGVEDAALARVVDDYVVALLRHLPEPSHGRWS